MARYTDESRAEKAARQRGETLYARVQINGTEVYSSAPSLAAWEILDAATKKRKQLLQAGFLPLPALGKAVLLEDWTNTIATDEAIDKWEHDHKDWLNTGISTRNTPAIDNDVYIPEVAEEIDQMIRDQIEDGGHIMTRIGEAPKRAILCRTNEPFDKIVTPIFTSPNGKNNKVEILGDGQQIVVDGIHPDTRKRYTWHGGQPGEVPCADLPILTKQVAEAIRDKATAIMRAHGWTEKNNKTTGAKPNTDGNGHTDWTTQFDAIYGGREQKYAAVTLDNIVANLAAMAPESGRNDAANAGAYKAGQMIARGWLDEATPRRRIEQACVTNKLVDDTGEKAVQATLNSGFEAGKANPHPDLPDRNPPPGTTPAPTDQLDNLKSWWRDPATISKRQFLDIDRHYCRGAIGATIAAGGRGKTTRCVYEAISFRLGRDLSTGAPLPEGPLRVLVLNGEEDRDELDRRVAAACQHYGVTENDLGDGIFIKSVRNTPMRIASLVNNRPVIDLSIRDAIAGFVGYNHVDVFMVDPLVSFHNVVENDNIHMDVVIKQGFGSIASSTHSVGEVFHHPGKPKPGQAETTVEDGRGASAIIWAVRSARVFNFMATQEATKLGIHEDERRLYVRISNGKANMGPLGKAKWMKLCVESLSNGDEVACASSWAPQSPFHGLTVADMELAQQLARTGAFRVDNRSVDWFGYILAEHLHIPVSYGAENDPKDVARLKTIIKTWIKNDALRIEKRKDSGRKERDYIIPGDFKGTVPIEDDDDM
jgi:hypothetical protein